MFVSSNRQLRVAPVCSVSAPNPTFSFRSKLQHSNKINVGNQGERANKDCQTCRYPFSVDDRSSCGAVDYLLRWKEDEHLKPYGFDNSIHMSIPNLCADVAATSIGGRHNGAFKSNNQDTFLLQPLSNHVEEHCQSSFLIGVFDGHGKWGHHVASRAKQAISAHAISSPPPPPHAEEDSHHEWMHRCFSYAADAVDSSDTDISRSGATAVVCSIQPGRITAAWAGDSRAVLGLHSSGNATTRPSRVVIPLTRDHKPDPFSCPHEAQRILQNGGRVDRLATDQHGNPIGPFRVFLPSEWTPGLALSRAFGDHIAKDIGIVPTPEIFSLPVPIRSQMNNNTLDAHRYTGNTHVLIVASDGLWEWLTSEQAVTLAWEQATAQDATNALIEAAKSQWACRYRGRTCDDITVAVAMFH